ncbi:hypothetical protein IscW_ISCW012804 [Ixodes scapularis]|uniref:Uncharacterized protein n=1 Tax=Ixodes scapularis TaxID=6945 RepID=B7QC06_IXOSC|nr:hypothetical protein IscW_ISCW012804 [Ixodes scapularis]|eukprot:XP_002413070.1 hypothetical protein IscW_ISCW012804 [Ixodes scapularis]
MGRPPGHPYPQATAREGAKRRREKAPTVPPPEPVGTVPKQVRPVCESVPSHRRRKPKHRYTRSHPVQTANRSVAAMHLSSKAQQQQLQDPSMHDMPTDEQAEEDSRGHFHSIQVMLGLHQQGGSSPGPQEQLCGPADYVPATNVSPLDPMGTGGMGQGSGMLSGLVSMSPCLGLRVRDMGGPLPSMSGGAGQHQSMGMTPTATVVGGDPGLTRKEEPQKSKTPEKSSTSDGDKTAKKKKTRYKHLS